MKKIKLLTPIFTLVTTSASILPIVACNDKKVDDTTVDVTVVDTAEDVTLEKTKAEKGKRFETKVSFDTIFYMNKVTVKMGGTPLKEGDIDVGDDSQFFYDYINNILTIKEGIIDDNIELTFGFTYVFNDTVSYVPGHVPYLISNHEIYIKDTTHPYAFYLFIDFTEWPEIYKNQFPQYFCFSMNSDIEYNATFTSTPEILSILPEDPINVTLVDDGKGNVDKCFKLDGNGYGYGKNLRLFMYMQCTFDSSNHFRFYGLNR